MKVIHDRTARRPDPFIRAAFAKAQGAVTKQGFEAFLGKDDTVSELIITRAAATPGSTTGSGWAAELAQNAFPDFLGTLSPISGGARIIAASLKAEVGTRDRAKY